MTPLLGDRISLEDERSFQSQSVVEVSEEKEKVKFGQERKPLPVDAKIRSSKKPRKKTKVDKSLEKTSTSLQ